MQNVKDVETVSVSALSGLLGRTVARTQRLRRGRNSRVYVLECDSGPRYVAKHYFKPEPGGRDTLSAEFLGLQFLWEQGERAIPQPILADRDSGLAVYEFVEGTNLAPTDMGQGEVDQAVSFLLRLKALSQQPEALELDDAAEACFSLSSIAGNLEARLNRLICVDHPDSQTAGLKAFLSGSFQPAFTEIAEACEKSASKLGISFGGDLEQNARTLSPSDFGSHNAIRKPDGRLVFLDFEYFGWDDPAKMVSDFLLHPAMELGKELKRRFFTETVAGLGPDRLLEDRVRILCPLFALKWCLILLNEFVPQDQARRAFATGTGMDLSEVRKTQLGKARKMLDTAKEYHAKFPF